MWWVHSARPAFSEMSSKMMGPDLTKPPAVMTRCCESSWMGWGDEMSDDSVGFCCADAEVVVWADAIAVRPNARRA